MKTLLSSVDFKEIVLIKDIPDNINSKEGITEFNIDTSILGIEGSKRVLALDGIYIENNKVSLPNDLSLYAKKDVPHLELHFELEGFTSFSNGKTANETINIPEGYGLLLYLPELDGKLNFARNPQRKSLEIEFTEDYLLEMFNNDLEILGDFGKAINSKLPTFFGGQSFKITPEMYSIISDISVCKYHGILKKIYIESKIREILVTYIQHTQPIFCSKENKVQSQKDIEKLNVAREIIKQNIAKPFSILELSKLVGLNDFKLKKGFKDLFGNTIFGYINDLRMQEAKVLLTNTQRSIAEISYHVGFKNPQHFTVAFKRKFGFLPKTFRINE